MKKSRLLDICSKVIFHLMGLYNTSKLDPLYKIIFSRRSKMSTFSLEKKIWFSIFGLRNIREQCIIKTLFTNIARNSIKMQFLYHLLLNILFLKFPQSARFCRNFAASLHCKVRNIRQI